MRAEPVLERLIDKVSVKCALHWLDYWIEQGRTLEYLSNLVRLFLRPGGYIEDFVGFSDMPKSSWPFIGAFHVARFLSFGASCSSLFLFHTFSSLNGARERTRVTRLGGNSE